MKKIFITAGEESGDVLAADLMVELKKRYSEVQFYGVGGARMQAEGLQSLFPMEELSVMGVLEVLPKLRNILRRIKQTADYIIKKQPDIVITVDAQDFSFRVITRVRHLEQAGDDKDRLKCYHYVAPTVWAWREERAAKLSKLYDGVFCLFPMEPVYFQREGMEATFIGHPAIVQAQNVRGNLRAELGIDKKRLVIGVLFGSRLKELHSVGPVIRNAILRLARALDKNCEVVAVTLPHLEKHVHNLTHGLGCKVHIVSDRTKKWQAFKTMDYAVATSGTVGLELALAEVPHVIAYKANALTAAIIKRKIKVSDAHLANIILGRRIVPEFIQQTCKPREIYTGLLEIINDKARVKLQQDGFKELHHLLSPKDDDIPSRAIVKAIEA